MKRPTLLLGEVQAVALGLGISGGPDPGDPDDLLRHFRVQVCLGIQDPEELLQARRFTFRPREVVEIEAAWRLVIDAVNLVDAQLETHVGRGNTPEGRQHLREELAALSRLGARLTQMLQDWPAAS